MVVGFCLKNVLNKNWRATDIITQIQQKFLLWNFQKTFDVSIFLRSELIHIYFSFQLLDCCASVSFESQSVNAGSSLVVN
jgi:hypothetical protein